MAEEENPTHDHELMDQPNMTEEEFFLLDRNSPEFIAELRRQVKAVDESEQEKEDLAFLDSLIADLPWWQDDSDWAELSEP